MTTLPLRDHRFWSRKVVEDTSGRLGVGSKVVHRSFGISSRSAKQSVSSPFLAGMLLWISV